MTGKYWDRGWSLVDGCTPCSPGCDHCWSAGLAHRFAVEGEPGHRNHILTDDKKRFNGIVIVNPRRLDIPLKTRKPTVFAVWNDLFHEDVPFWFQTDVWLNMCLTHRHTYLVLTKRAEVMRTFVSAWKMSDFPHVWLGVTVCNQTEADEKIPLLLQTPAAHRWVSIEPMLSSIDLRNLREGTFNALDGIDHEDIGDVRDQGIFHDELGGLNAVILGGETGPGARPCKPSWVMSVKDQCESAGVPFFFKQWGDGYRKGAHIDGEYIPKGRLLDGREHNELPWRKE